MAGNKRFRCRRGQNKGCNPHSCSMKRRSPALLPVQGHPAQHVIGGWAGLPNGSMGFPADAYGNGQRLQRHVPQYQPGILAPTARQNPNMHPGHAAPTHDQMQWVWLRNLLLSHQEKIKLRADRMNRRNSSDPNM